MAAYFGSYHDEQRLNEYDTAFYSRYGDVTCTYDDSFRSLDEIFHIFLSYDSSSLSVGEFSYGSNALPYRREDGFKGSTQHANGMIKEAYGQEYQPFIGCWNWLSEYNLYSNGSAEDFPRNDFYNQDHDNDVEKTENIYASDERPDSFYEDLGKHLACDYNFWDGHLSKFGQGEEDSIEYGRQELKPTESYHQDEIEFCNCVFGYWPCLFRGMPYKV